MHLHVLLKQLLFKEHLSTDLTGFNLLSAVDLLVSPQRSVPWETLSTNITAKWFDSSVAPFMRLYILKCLPADLARPFCAEVVSV